MSDKYVPITEAQDAKNQAALERYQLQLALAERAYAYERDRMHTLRGMVDALTLLVEMHADQADPPVDNR